MGRGRFRRSARLPVWVGFVAAFGGAVGHQAFPSGVQHTYLAKAVAQSLEPALRGDWFVQTVDPVPLFTWVCTVGLRALGPGFAELAWLVLAGAYALALARLGWTQAEGSGGRCPTAWLASIVLLHSAALRSGLSRLWPGLGRSLFEGFAEQTVLHEVLVPASLGVLLLVSLQCFAGGQLRWAGGLAGLAAVFHPTYLPASAALLVGYGLSGAGEGTSRRARGVGVALGGALWVVSAATVWWRFAGAPAAVELEAARILVMERVPHHAYPSLGLPDLLRLGMLGAGVVLLRRQRIFAPFVALVVVAVVGWIVVEWLDAPRWRLLFPWRASTVAQPIATVVVAANVWHAVAARRFGAAARRSLYAATVLVSIAGVARTLRHGEASQGRAGVALLHAHADAIASVLVPIEMLDARIGGGVPVFVDWKNHPYRADEVVAWRERIALARDFYAASDDERRRALVREAGVSHVLLGKQGCSRRAGLEPLAVRGDYRLCRVVGALAAGQSRSRSGRVTVL